MPTRFGGVVTQDWDPIVLRKSKPKSHDLRDPKAVNQALRTGAVVETVRKADAGTNRKKSGSVPAVDPRKLDTAEEPATLGRVTAEVREKIQRARLEKKLSQAELGKMINEPVKVVQEYENGKAVPNQGVLGKMEKVLGVKLRGLKQNK